MWDEAHEQQEGGLLTLGPAAPSGDVTLVVAVDAAGRVLELEVAGRRHAHHVNVLKRQKVIGTSQGRPVMVFFTLSPDKVRRKVERGNEIQILQC